MELSFAAIILLDDRTGEVSLAGALADIVHTAPGDPLGSRPGAYGAAGSSSAEANGSSTGPGGAFR